MLIEAHSRKLTSELAEKSQKDDTAEVDKDPLSMDVDEISSETAKKDSDDVESNEYDNKPPEDSTLKTSESDENPIDIDPKTYCKLGHFHLLLEDYAKGQ